MLNATIKNFCNLNRERLNILHKISINLIPILLISILFSFQSFSQPLANGNKKFVGNIINNGYSIPSTFSKYWNQVTPGNAGKWGSVEFSQGSYNFSQLDNIYNYAVSHNYPFKEHCLIWNSQQPGFMTDGSLDSLQEYQEIVNWIDTCAKRYPKTALCDVVNEPIDHAPPYKNALGGDGSTGWDWVIKAFQIARQYWPPTTKLLINEYNVINNSSRNATYLKIINLLKDRGLIDGIGVQAHSFEVVGPSTSTLKTYLDKLAATGLPIYISEFSINESDDNTQLQKYKSIFPMLFEDPGVKGITLWGYIQYDVWTQEPDVYLVTDRLAERPALLWLKFYFGSYLKTVLISPIDTNGIQRNPVLSWHSSTAASRYRIEVSGDSSFASNIIVDSAIADTLLQLDSLNANSKFYWRVTALNSSDTGSYSETASFTTGDQILSVKDYTKMPEKFTLYQNYPNPFNPSTQIKYTIGSRQFVSLKVYDILGREVATLVNEDKPAGAYEVEFNTSSSNMHLASGIYIYQLKSGNFISTKKMLLVK